MLQRGERSHEFFTEDGKHPFLARDFVKAYEDDVAGKWKQDIEIPIGTSLEISEQFLEGRNKEMIMAFMRDMLQWRPEDRKTAKDLLQDPWLNDRIG